MASLCTLFGQNSGRHTRDGQQISDIRNHRSTSPDHHLPPNLDKLANTSTDAYPAQISNPDATSQARTWTDVHGRAQHAVMINTTARVENSAQTDSSISVDDNASKDH